MLSKGIGANRSHKYSVEPDGKRPPSSGPLLSHRCGNLKMLAIIINSMNSSSNKHHLASALTFDVACGQLGECHPLAALNLVARGGALHTTAYCMHTRSVHPRPSKHATRWDSQREQKTHL